MQIVPSLWERINFLVPAPQCRTFGDDYDLVEWTDARAKPTVSQLLGVADQDLVDKRANDNAGNFADVKKSFVAVLEITYAFAKNPSLYATLAEYKTAVRDRYKVLNGS
jgi:hypothetical protein